MVLLVAALPAAALGAYPGDNGAIVFAGHSAGQDGLYLRAGGSIRALLLGGSIGDPVFSPLGRRIALTRDGAVWIVAAGGGGARRLIAGTGPAWAPSAGSLAYASGLVGARTIHVINADGTGDRAVTSGPRDQYDPVWSRRRVIAFVQANPHGEDVYTLRAGGVPRRLTSRSGDDRDPAWAPRGERIAFVRASGKRRGVWVMSRWGHGQRRVVHVRGGTEQGVAWSPDGRRLLFAGGPAGRRRIYSVRPDGKRRHLRALSLPSSDGRDPDWRPVGHDPVIAAAGDIACDPAARLFREGAGTPHFCGMRRTSNLLLRTDLWDVLVLGDEQYPDGDLGRINSSFAPSWGRLKPLLRPVPGNHEYGTPGAAGYFDYFNGPGVQAGRAGDRARGGYYSFDVGTWHVVALDSNCEQVPGGCEVGSPQQTWLAADLARHRRSCTLAYWHHPLYSSLAHEEGRGSRQTAALWQTLYDAGADLVLSGHQHFYERLLSQDANGHLDAARGIRSFVVGTGGKGLDGRDVVDPESVVFHDSSFGILELTLHPRHYDWRYRTTNGDPFTDTGSAACH